MFSSHTAMVFRILFKNKFAELKIHVTFTSYSYGSLKLLLVTFC